MSQPIPTVEEVLERTHSGFLSSDDEPLHLWRTEGSSIEVPASKLRAALENAFDPFMPDWVAMVEIGDD